MAFRTMSSRTVAEREAEGARRREQLADRPFAGHEIVRIQACLTRDVSFGRDQTVAKMFVHGLPVSVIFGQARMDHLQMMDILAEAHAAFIEKHGRDAAMTETIATLEIDGAWTTDRVGGCDWEVFRAARWAGDHEGGWLPGRTREVA